MNHFQNGVQKAQTEIQNKLDKVGVKLENASFTLKSASQVQKEGEKLGKILSTSEADHLAQAVRDGAWDDDDVRGHIQRSNYKKKPYEQQASPGSGSMAGVFSRRTPNLSGYVGGGSRFEKGGRTGRF